jgi:hypothetical protein
MSNIFKFAENILNNLDQSTQSSIQTALNKSTSSHDDDKYANAKLSSLPGSSSAASLGRIEKTNKEAKNSSNANMKSSWHAKTSSLSHKDDELMQFLNDDTSIETMSDPLARSSKSSLFKTDTSGKTLQKYQYQ